MDIITNIGVASGSILYTESFGRVHFFHTSLARPFPKTFTGMKQAG